MSPRDLHDIPVAIDYQVPGPSKERILEQAELNGSLVTARQVAQRYDRDDLILSVTPFKESLRQADYGFDDWRAIAANPNLTLHGFLIAGENEPITLGDEIQRASQFIPEKFLEDLKVNPEDFKKNQPFDMLQPMPTILAARNYVIRNVEIVQPHPALSKKLGGGLTIPTDVRVTLEPVLAGKNYRNEKEFFEKEIKPLLKGARAEDVSKAIYNFRAELNNRFPLDSKMPYHHDQLLVSHLALKDLERMVRAKNSHASDIEDITGKIANSALIEAIQKNTPLVEAYSLTNIIFSTPELAQQLLEKEKKGEPLTIDVPKAKLIYRR